MRNLPTQKAVPSSRKPLVAMVALASLASNPIAFAQESSLALEEVVVSARKRTESLQDVPISVQALGSQQLKDLGISDFASYAAQLPTVSYTSIGPGTAIVYMRGASDGGNGNASGSQPSVGMYLDEAPVTAIGGNLDVHIYDVARIEALAGPQGTLYGASSQSGTLRIITNKPDPSAFSAGVDVGYSDTDEGDDSYSVEGFVNLPLSEKAAIRLVAWDTEDGGWIDNVPGTRNLSPLSPSGTSVQINNNNLVEKDQNVVENTGLRAALRVDLDDNWTATVSAMKQEQDSSGAFDHDPFNNDDNEISRYFDDYHDDEFSQYAITLEGEIAGHSLTYAGSYMERDVDYQSDYTAYSEYSTYSVYYACDYYGTGVNECSSNAQFYQSTDEYERTSHELRLQSLGEGPFHYVGGFYYEELTHDYLQEWIQPDMSESFWARGKPGIFYTTDQKRVDEQYAIFGELTYDITDDLSATFGVRSFDNENTLTGYTGWGIVNGGDLSYLVDSSNDDKGEIFKLNLTWNASEDVMLYTTWSEGYRSGGINRDPAAPQSAYQPDILTNYEFGWKTTWMDGQLRWNGALYYIEWEDMQFTIYDFALSPVSNTYNVGEAEITGLETDLTYQISAGWTVYGSMAYKDGETADDFELANGAVSSPDGTELPNVPELKYTLTTRYEFDLMGQDSYTQASYSYTDDSYNDLRPDSRIKQDDYMNLNVSAGFNTGKWGAELYVNNLTNETDNISVGNRVYEPSATTQRPRTIGVSLSMSFD
jgi:outer membrane receptor protein involved in Fe transport